MKPAFEGTFTALVTPFRDGSVDEEAVRALASRQVEAGNGLVPCGTTGETPTLSEDEHLRVVELCVQVADGRVPVVAGAGANGTAKAIAIGEKCRALGADGLLVVCPYYNKPTQAGLEAHFRAVAEAVPLPIMLYNVPGRTGVDLSTATTLRLAQVENIVAIKEASGDVLRSQALVAGLAAAGLGPADFTVLSGDDALTLPVMVVGGAGVVSVTANRFPTEVAEVVQLAAAGRWAEARQAHLRLVPLHEAMFVETNPIPIKALMHDADLLAAEVRLPLTWASPTTLEAGRQAAAAAGLEQAS